MPKELTKREASEARKLAAEERQGPPPEIVRPAEPWIIGDRITENGYAMIEQSAELAEPMEMAGVLLGMEKKKFFKLIKADERVAFALEAGEVKCQAALMRTLQIRATGPKKDSDAAKFILRGKFGLRESGDSSVTVNIGGDHRIGIVPGGTLSDEDMHALLRKHADEQELLPAEERRLLLPGSMSLEKYREKYGKTIDARDTKLIVSTMRNVENKTDDEIRAYLKEHDRKDYEQYFLATTEGEQSNGQ
jgi:hypothetical protein